jgi:RNA methyltransferase, TrmH family
MLSKSKTKFIRSLQLRKYRQKYHKIVVEGIKILNELLDECPECIATICGQHDWHDEFVDSIPGTCEVIRVTEREMKQLTSFKTPPPVLAVVRPFLKEAVGESAETEMCLYLDAIRDPGNLGTIFRIADWFGVTSIFLSPDTVDPFNPKVIQSSMASIFRVKWAYAHIEDLLDGKNLTVLASTLDGKLMKDIKTLNSGLLVLGNESRGISKEILKHATECITIPDCHKLGAESLNVAVAAGILCAHFRLTTTD